jgi:hypothetical protein
MRSRLSLGITFAVVLAVAPLEVLSQDLDKGFLNSTVHIKYWTDPAHTRWIQGTGFLLAHLVSVDPVRNVTNFKLLLITNKHVLPPEHGGAREIIIRLAVRSENGRTEVKDVTLPVLGNDGKYLPSVGLHPDPAVDVAVVNVTEDMVREHSDFVNRIAETHEALMTIFSSQREIFTTQLLGSGLRFTFSGTPAEYMTLVTCRQSFGWASFQPNQTRTLHSIKN